MAQPSQSHRDGQRGFAQLTLKSVKLNKTLRLANTSSKLSRPGVTHFPVQGSLFEKLSKKTPIEMIPDVFGHKNLNAMEFPVLILGSLHLGLP